MSRTSETLGACPHDCPDTCSLVTTVQDGRAVRVRGNRAHPPTDGVLCTKVSRYAERTHHPERILTPLRRVGAKGEGRFEPIGWDAALDEIAERLTAIAARDAQAILPYSYAGTRGLVQGESMDRRFFHRLGASRLDRTICATAGGEALTRTLGGKLGMRVEFFAESKLILIWGSNPIASSLHFWRLAQQARRGGARLACIDPRRSEPADKCDEHIPLLPGTDAALALCIMHELIAHDWLVHDYIERHTLGWPALRERALRWHPERVAAVCGIPAEQVRDLARAWGTTRPAAIRLNYGVQRCAGGGNAVRAIACLPALTGAWRQRAGDAAALSGGPAIEALVVYNSNPVAVAPESPKVVRGFAREDLFTVVLEHFRTDTADHADIVLPATTQLEHWDIHAAYGHTDVLLNRPAIAPLGQAKSNAQIFRELAARMGFDEPCFADSDEALCRQAYGERVDFEQLLDQGFASLQLPEAPFAQGGFPTPSGCCEFDSEQSAIGGDRVPDHVPNREPSGARAAYPLAMISPPARHFLNSSFVNVQSLRSIEGEPLLEIHPHDAAPRGIVSGALVEVFNERGRYHCSASVTERARPGVVNGLGIWWRKLGPRGTNVNELTSQALTDLGRGPTFYDCAVQVAAAAPAQP